MDILTLGEAALAVLLLLILLPVLYVLVESRRPSLPGPGLRQYLPNGLVHPMLVDPRRFSFVLDKLADQYGDVFELWLGPSRAIVTSNPTDIAHVLPAVDVFPRPKAFAAVFQDLAPGGIFTMPTKTHREVRRKLRDSFNHSMLKSFQADMTKAVGELCESLTAVVNKENGGPSQVVDISQLLAITTFRVITNVAFGINMDREERLRFADAVNNITKEMMEDYMHYPFRQALTRFGARNKFFEYRRTIVSACNKFIKQRVAETKEEREAREPDMLDAILALEGCPAEALASLTTEFTLAGYHTTAQMTAWGIYETCCNPRVASEIQKELSTVLGNRPITDPLSLDDMQTLPYITSVWKETCRLHPVGSVLNRKATRDVVLKGSRLHVRKGTNVLAFIRRCQVHPDIWKDPKAFVPERWGTGSEKKESILVPPGSYVPFGIGPIGCAGRFLADYEGPLILAELRRRFEFTLACKPEEVKNMAVFVDTPRYIDRERGMEMGVPIHVRIRTPE